MPIFFACFKQAKLLAPAVYHYHCGRILGFCFLFFTAYDAVLMCTLSATPKSSSCIISIVISMCRPGIIMFSLALEARLLFVLRGISDNENDVLTYICTTCYSYVELAVVMSNAVSCYTDVAYNEVTSITIPSTAKENFYSR